MTCKDCLLRRKCTDKNKSYNEINGDSWANWCENFDTRHKGRTVKYKGCTVHQTGYNWHIWVLGKNDELLMHAQCTKKQSKRKLKSYVDFALKMQGEIDVEL